MLSVSGLQSAYGPSQVLFDVELSVGEGEVVTLLGRNGMGKTTTVRSIMGLLKPSAGTVQFTGREVSGATPETVARLGVGLVPEGRQTFPTLTVRENLVATASNRLKRQNPWTLERVYALFPRLGERAGQAAGTLSGGEQQMLAVGRALMTNPKLLILDEATEGLAPLVAQDIWKTLSVIRGEGIATIVVDKDFRSLAKIADRTVLLSKGAVVFDGAPASLIAQPELLERHLGV
jgi:branched-chain amino acid transport system ATP-binding protein